jgi:cytochrome c biogenesis protein CcdA/thiol-disulfide isomerase/thioredoxin
MGILAGFAFVAGLVTILAPCIWPLLPIILSAAATGGRRKPLGIAAGIVTSFALLTLSLAYILRVIPFNPDTLRIAAVVIIGFFGLMLAVPPLSRRLEGFASRLAGRFSIGDPKTGSGLFSGFVVGCSLGVVWTPCAGPILATIAALASTQKVTASVVLVTIAYVVGVGIPLFLFASLGKMIFARSRVLSRYTGRIQQVFGVVMILAAAIIFLGYDRVLQAKVLDWFPSYNAILTSIENRPAVTERLEALKGKTAAVRRQGPAGDYFNADYPAPALTGITRWLNTDHPLSLAELRGKVVLIDFWTYTCINCIRTLPHVTHWYDTYKNDGFVVIGVHTPEFQFEKNADNVEAAIRRFHIHYPVALDNDYAVWNAFDNRYWPAEYLIDADGIVRRTHFGEGEYGEMETAIRELLAQSGEMPAAETASIRDETPRTELSPETYFGLYRMEYYYPSGTTEAGRRQFTLDGHPPLNRFSFGGEWTISDEKAAPGNSAVLVYHFSADQVFAVLKPEKAGRQFKMKVFLDGKPVEPSHAGGDVRDGTVTVDADRLYRLTNLRGNPGDHILRLEFPEKGIELYTLTFG